MTEKFSLKARLNSFPYAFCGLIDLLRREHNAWIHLLATVLVVILAVYCRLQPLEWVAIVLVIAAVWSAEALNTAVEYLADACMPEQHPLIKRAKDVAAAAVLIMAAAAVLVGLIIFVPYF